jgi:FkbM family methyltransferase
MTNYYSQHGEDYILSEMFKDQKDGFFVEIGCIDGKRFSNTLTFEERGWKGMCVEAHSDYIDLLRKNRPGSLVCHCAVGEKDDDNVPFYANSRGSLSTLDISKEDFYREHYSKYFTGFEEQRVAIRTLTTLFREYEVAAIDIISIDIEGYEIEALKGLDLHRYRPRVILIESDSVEQENQIDEILSPRGYIKFVHVGENIIYIRKRR